MQASSSEHLHNLSNALEVESEASGRKDLFGARYMFLSYLSRLAGSDCLTISTSYVFSLDS